MRNRPLNPSLLKKRGTSRGNSGDKISTSWLLPCCDGEHVITGKPILCSLCGNGVSGAGREGGTSRPALPSRPLRGDWRVVAVDANSKIEFFLSYCSQPSRVAGSGTNLQRSGCTAQSWDQSKNSQPLSKPISQPVHHCKPPCFLCAIWGLINTKWAKNAGK